MSGIISISGGAVATVQSGTLAAGPGYVAPAAPAPAYALFDNSSGVLSKYPGDGGAADWTVSNLFTGAKALGVDKVNKKFYVPNNSGWVYKLDGITGAEDWKVRPDDAQVHGPRVAVDQNGDLYYGNKTGAADPMRKLQASDGAIIWNSSPPKYNAYKTTIYSQAENAVYTCHASQFVSTGLVKRDATTGVEVWNITISGNPGFDAWPEDGVLLSNGNIALVTVGLTSGDGHFIVIDASTGAEVVKTSLNVGDQGGMITADATHVFISSTNTLYAFTHAGVLVDSTTLTGTFPDRPMATRALTGISYMTNNQAGTVNSMSIVGGVITFGASIGPYGTGYQDSGMEFLD